MRKKVLIRKTIQKSVPRTLIPCKSREQIRSSKNERPE